MGATLLRSPGPSRPVRYTGAQWRWAARRRAVRKERSQRANSACQTGPEPERDIEPPRWLSPHDANPACGRERGRVVLDHSEYSSLLILIQRHLLGEVCVAMRPRYRERPTTPLYSAAPHPTAHMLS